MPARSNSSSSDTAAGVLLPPNSTLTGGVGTFSATFVTPGNQTLTATDTVHSSGPSTSLAPPMPFVTRGLVVTSFTTTSNGFTIDFNKPFNPTYGQPLHHRLLARRRYPGHDQQPGFGPRLAGDSTRPIPASLSSRPPRSTPPAPSIRAPACCRPATTPSPCAALTPAAAASRTCLGAFWTAPTAAFPAATSR